MLYFMYSKLAHRNLIIFDTNYTCFIKPNNRKFDLSLKCLPNHSVEYIYFNKALHISLIS